MSKKDKVLSIKLTAEQLEKLTKAADGEKLSVYARKRIFDDW